MTHRIKWQVTLTLCGFTREQWDASVTYLNGFYYLLLEWDVDMEHNPTRLKRISTRLHQMFPADGDIMGTVWCAVDCTALLLNIPEQSQQRAEAKSHGSECHQICESSFKLLMLICLWRSEKFILVDLKTTTTSVAVAHTETPLSIGLHNRPAQAQCQRYCGFVR